MTVLSVCMLTREPAARVAAVLEPVRTVADEVVIAADARVDAATLAGYAALADRLLRVEFLLYESHLAWLHEQCRGNWILRLDGDELVSAALAGRLAELVAARDVQQYWLARAWIHADGESVLVEAPWAHDFDNRLVRNDGTLRFRGVAGAHADPVHPCEYIQEPVYHLALPTTDLDERRDRAVRDEVMRPCVPAPGGGRRSEARFLPELRGPLATRPLPEVDRAAVRRAIAAQMPVAARDPGPLPVASGRLREVDGAPDSAYRATIEPIGPPPVMVPGDARQVLFGVVNQGTERWPWGLDGLPAIRLGQRWLHADGSLHSEGVRTGFPRSVGPGDSVLVLVETVAPSEPGDYLLEVDVLHEFVRWFEQPCRLPVAVRPSWAPAPTEARLHETPPPRGRRFRRVRIPPVLHRVWLGDAPIPESQVAFGRTFEHHHPGWNMRLWTDEALAQLAITDSERSRARSAAELSNLVRYEVLHRHGGVYVDTDVECRRSFSGLLAGVEVFAGLELPGRVGTAVLGAVPGHRVFERAARITRLTLGLGDYSVNANGPYFMSVILEQEPGVTIFGEGVFYPYRWDEPERAGEAFPDAYAVHRWANSWSAGEGVAES